MENSRNKTSFNRFLYFFFHFLIWGYIIYLYLTTNKVDSVDDVIKWLTTSIIFVFLMILMYSKSTISNPSTLEYQSKIKWKPDIVHIFIIILAGFLLNLLINNLYTSLFGNEILPNDKLIMKNVGLYIPFYISVCIVSPIFEEIVFRGYFYTLISDITSDAKIKNEKAIFIKKEKQIRYVSYIIISSTIFGLLHKQEDFYSFLTYALFGVILSIIFIITKKIWPGIILHVMNNTYAVIGLLYVKDEKLGSWLIDVSLIIALIIAVIMALQYPRIKEYVLLLDKRIASKNS